MRPDCWGHRQLDLQLVATLIRLRRSLSPNKQAEMLADMAILAYRNLLTAAVIQRELFGQEPLLGH